MEAGKCTRLTITITALGICAAALASCGGGGASGPLDDPGLQRGSASLDGRIETGADIMAGGSPGGVSVQRAAVVLYQSGNGNVVASGNVAADGSFSFSGLEPGSYELKQQLASNIDFDSDGSAEMVQFSSAVQLSSGGNLLVSSLSGFDMDADGKLEGIDVNSRLSAEGSLRSEVNQRLLLSEGSIVVDVDGDGSLDDELIRADVDGDGQVDGSINISAGDSRIDVSGAIDGLTSDTITIDGRRFAIDGETMVFSDAGMAIDTSAIDASGFARVQAEWDGSAWHAEVIVAASAAVSVDPAEPEAVDLEPIDIEELLQDVLVISNHSGEIEAAGSGFVRIEGKRFLIDAGTEIHVDGEGVDSIDAAMVGEMAMLSARQEGSASIAISIEVWTEQMPADPLVEDSVMMVVEFSGQLQAKSEGSITLDGRKVIVNSATQFSASGSLLAGLSALGIGDELEVEAIGSGENWTAISVEVLDAGLPGDLF